jgi:hypothetical protein
MSGTHVAHLTDRISHCAIILAGGVCGVVVFVVALPLALSSPFPTPRQSEWIVQNPSFDGLAGSTPLLPPPMEPLAVDQPADEPAEVLTSSLGDRPQPMAFATRWDLTVPERRAAAPAAVAPITVPTEATRMAPADKTARAAPPKRRDLGGMEPVDQYLWEVYQRKTVKSDSSGDFTWKDPAAAKHMGISLQSYVIGGMDPDFREQLYHAGRAMDADGLQWSMLSAFRDDYRQGLAAGYKAHGGNSQHGGSRATGGYGHGRAIDITNADGEASAIWHWIDTHGAKYGLRRPMPGYDPAHIQPKPAFHELAHQLREARVKLASQLARTAPDATADKTKVAEGGDEPGEGRRARR